jgi:hypothetical protein
MIDKSTLNDVIYPGSRGSLPMMISNDYVSNGSIVSSNLPSVDLKFGCNTLNQIGDFHPFGGSKYFTLVI